ncbi:MAG: M20/M25/M40 family metallo-hydrolase [Planctomycetota bacterium]
MKALRYAKRLVSFDSTSKKTNRLISRYLESKLIKHGFVVEKIEYRDPGNVRKVNLVAKKGVGVGGLAYFAHSDVVPARDWHTMIDGPFSPTVKNGRLYGRGSCDMKGSIAAMLQASQKFDLDQLKKPFYFVVTADEEVGFLGAKCVVEESKQYREMVDHGTKAIIGEPTSLEVVHAHKGSIKIVAKSLGEAAHSSTREGKNSNFAMIPFLGAMKKIIDETERDSNWQNELFDPPTLSWNIVIKDNAPALNIKPSKSICVMYMRTMPDVDVQPLIDRVSGAAAENGIDLSITKFAEPFYASSSSEFVKDSLELAERNVAKTVSYGTDGGALSEIEDKIVLGPGSIAQAHTNNEWISLEQLKLGVVLYERMIQKWCT